MAQSGHTETFYLQQMEKSDLYFESVWCKIVHKKVKNNSGRFKTKQHQNIEGTFPQK